MPSPPLRFYFGLLPCKKWEQALVILQTGPTYEDGLRVRCLP